MTVLSLRPLGLLILSLALVACASTAPADATPATSALGVDLGRSGPVAARAGEGHSPYSETKSNIHRVHEGHAQARGTGTVNAVYAAQHKLNISHEPIAAIGFPAMTMDFAVAPSVNLGALKPGSRINFSIEQGEGGMYVIQSVGPASGGAR
jgi:Cu(I)/Ag(I) efflux system protein CusF